MQERAAVLREVMAATGTSQSSLARIYGSALAIGETIEEVRRWPVEIETVLKDDLASAAERYLIPRRSVTGYLQKSAS